MNFSWLSHSVQEVNESTRQVILAKEDFCLFNPNTFNCPIFRTRNDFDLTKKIYKATPIIFNERTGDNPWEVSFMLMFMMNTDSKLFAAEASPEKVPLYEGKMFYQFDHRYSTYEGVSQAQLNVGTLPQPSSETKANPSFNVQPRYWVDLNEVEKRLGDKWNKNWLIAFRDICRSTDERTFIVSPLPRIATGNKAPLLFIEEAKDRLATCFIGCLNSLVFDFSTRQKIGGATMKKFIVKQLPVRDCKVVCVKGQNQI